MLYSAFALTKQGDKWKQNTSKDLEIALVLHDLEKE
jgi:hypothetical protein